MKYSLLLVFLLFSFNAFCQELNSLLREIPQKITGLSNDDIIQLFKNYNNGIMTPQQGVGNNKHFLMEYDITSGYLSYGGAYEGINTMTYWNLTNGTKLIAHSSTYGGPAIDQSIHFFLKNGSTLIKLSLHNVLPTININDFFDLGKMTQDGIDITEILDRFYHYSIVFTLPQKGTSVTAYSDFVNLDMENNWKKYLITDIIELKWDDGVFRK